MKTKGQIADWWKDKYIDNETFEIVDGSVTEFSVERHEWVIVDLDAPACWACGKRCWIDEGDHTLKEIWNKYSLGLQRCHITSRQFGGTDEEKNQFLMCDSCHFESPDTRKRKTFFQWVLYQRRENSFDKQLLRGLEVAAEIKGYDFSKLVIEYQKRNNDGVLELLKKAYNDSALHGWSFSLLSICCNLIDEMEESISDVKR